MTFNRFRLFAGAICGMLACAGCGGRSGATDSNLDAASAPEAGANAEAASTLGAAALPACGWPASFDPADAAESQCVAARTLLNCNGPSGGGECISNDPNGCDFLRTLGDGGGFTCVNECTLGEYALSCGPGTALGPTNAPQPVPPAACRVWSGRNAFYCCPCGG